jgi:hypothetical protein
MTVIYCDVCKKEIPDARKDINYVTYLDKDLCQTCEEKLRVTMRQQSAAHKPVIFKNYQESMGKTLSKMCGSR